MDINLLCQLTAKVVTLHQYYERYLAAIDKNSFKKKSILRELMTAQEMLT